MLLSMTTLLYPERLDMTILDICLRLSCALLVGVVIGTEREYTHRPAGMRTHMLVSLGACVVMMIGQLIYVQYQSYGATPDPARLGAQVITGVGFLGAGTIMREGPTVKGLTTAASLWATACLGLAAGGGYYGVALAGMIFIFVTLTIFEVFQKKLVGSHRVADDYQVTANDISAGLKAVNTQAASAHATISSVEAQLDKTSGNYLITFRADFDGSRPTRRKQRFFEALISCENIIAVHTSGEFSRAGVK